MIAQTGRDLLVDRVVLDDALEREPRPAFRPYAIVFKAPAGGVAKFVPALSPVLGADGRPTATDGKGTTNVTFNKPGNYVVRAYSMDPDSFFVYQDVKVRVTN